MATCEEREEWGWQALHSTTTERRRGGARNMEPKHKLWLRYYSQRPFVSACRGTSRITIVIYCLFVWTQFLGFQCSILDSAFNKTAYIITSYKDNDALVHGIP